MTKPLRYLLVFLLGVTATVALVWLCREQLVTRIVRPWLVARLAQELAADVRLERLSVAWGEIELAGLAVKRDTFDLHLAEAVVRFDWPGLTQFSLTALTLRQPQVHLRLDQNSPPTDPQPAGFAASAPLTIEHWVIEDGELQLSWPDNRSLRIPVAGSGRIGAVADFALSGRVTDHAGTDFRMTGRGLWQHGIELTLEEFAWDGRLLLAEPVTFRTEGTGPLAGRLTLSELADHEVVPLLKVFGYPPPWPAGVSWLVREPVLDFTVEPANLQLSLQLGDGSVQTADRHLTWQSAAVRIDGVQTGSWRLVASLHLAGQAVVTLSGDWDGTEFLGRGELALPDPGATVHSFSPELSVLFESWQALEAVAEIAAAPGRIEVRSARASGRWQDRILLRTVFDGDWQPERLTLVGHSIELLARHDGNVLASGLCDLEWQAPTGQWLSTFRLQSDDVAGSMRTFGLPVPLAWPAVGAARLDGAWRWHETRLDLSGAATATMAGAGLQAQLSARFSAALATAHGFDVVLESVALSELEYSSADGTIMLTGGSVDLVGRLAAHGDKLNFDLGGRVGAGEALVKSWYADLQELPLNLQVTGFWQTDRRQLSLAAAELDLAGLITSRFDGLLAADHVRLAGRVDLPEVGGRTWSTVQHLGGELAPWMQHWQVEGVMSATVLAERRRQDWRLDLTIEPRALTLTWPDRLTLESLSGTVPLRFRRGDWAENGALPAIGRLDWQRLRGPLIDEPDGHLLLQASANRWSLLEPFEINLAGGRLRLSGLQLVFDGPEPYLRGSLRLQELSLAQVCRVLDWPEVSGLFSARLDDVEASRNLVRTAGDAAMTLFDGDFRIGNIEIRQPLSRFPTYHADIDFVGVDLSALTRTFEFGEINGIADGYVHGLRLFEGVPSAFTARFETRSDGVRNISVKAIRNLNTLSQGGLSAALSRGVYRFIDFYRYRKIGLVLSLANDLFHLRGSARDGSEQSLIDGGWLPPKIDVLVSSPTISFREMVGRLKRIERSGR
ncbi:MAG: hypothetical protein RQ723_03545 [Desulfuromonadales bacterium]|nr:hypothetical protein [Desulfuromonadales bacterium]